MHEFVEYRPICFSTYKVDQLSRRLYKYLVSIINNIFTVNMKYYIDYVRQLYCDHVLLNVCNFSIIFTGHIDLTIHPKRVFILENNLLTRNKICININDAV